MNHRIQAALGLGLAILGAALFGHCAVQESACSRGRPGE